MITDQDKQLLPTSEGTQGMGFLIYIFFVLSGMCGLVYEVVWDRYLVGFIGVTTYAHTVVLTTFMGGLALGSWLFGRLADRPFHGLRFYGWLEVGIGMYAVVFPYLFETMGTLYVILAKPFYPQIAWLTLGRFVLCTAVLLPPTILMGGTLPVLTNYLTNRRTSLRHRISFLYAANSGGAVLGTYLGGFWFIAEFGLPMTLVFIGIFNVLLGFTAVLFSRHFKPREAVEEEVSADDPDTTIYKQKEVNTAVLVAGLSGAITMALEVAWVRFWSLVLGSSTYSFSIMLMAFISGIALGSTIIASRFGHRRLTPMLFWVFFGTAAILLLGLPFYDRVPYWFARLRLLFADTHGSYLAYQSLVYFGCFLFMFVPTVLSGMALPMAIRMASRTIDRVGREVGKVYAINTIGTIIGSLGCGLVLLSWLGLEGTFRLLFVLYLIAAAVVWALCESQRRWLIATLVLLAGVHFFTYNSWNRMVMNWGLYRQTQARLVPQTETWGQYLKALASSGLKLKQVHEGHSTTVAIFQKGEAQLMMNINGKVDASLGDEFSQRMTSHLPILAHPHTQEGLVIGLGSGSTAAAMECYGLNRVDVVELHPEVVAGSRAFAPYTGNILSRPNVNLYVDDALHFLRVSRQQYDVIASEPTNPWQSGVGNLFTQEYYQLVSAHLKEGGILSQWIPTYEISDEVVYILLRTIASVFPYVELFQMQNDDLIVLASQQPIRPQKDLIQERLARPAVKKNLEDLGITTLAAIASLHMTTGEDLKRMLPRGQLNYLDYPSAEFKAPEPFFRQTSSVLQDKMDTRFLLRLNQGLWWNQLVGTRSGTPGELQGIRKSAQKARNNKIFWVTNRALLQTETWESLPEDLFPLRWREGQPGQVCRDLSSSKAMTVSQLSSAYKEEKRFFFEAYSVFYRPDPSCPTQLARKLRELDENRKNVWERELGLWLWIQGKQEQSVRLLQNWFQNRPAGRWEEGDEVQALHVLIRALVSTKQVAELKPALAALEKIQRWPEDFLTRAEARELLQSNQP
jgi:spermidine synthase